MTVAMVGMVSEIRFTNIVYSVFDENRMLIEHKEEKQSYLFVDLSMTESIFLLMEISLKRRRELHGPVANFVI